MTWVLIIIALTGDGRGGIFVQKVDFENQQLCESAKTNISKILDDGIWKEPGIKVSCERVRNDPNPYQ